MKKKKKKTKLGFGKVEVLGHTFTIEETEDPIVHERSIVYGLCMPYESLILLDSKQSKESLKQTFYHELLHAIDWLSHNEVFQYDEETVNVLARGLMTVKLE